MDKIYNSNFITKLLLITLNKYNKAIKYLFLYFNYFFCNTYYFMILYLCLKFLRLDSIIK